MRKLFIILIFFLLLNLAGCGDMGLTVVIESSEGAAVTTVSDDMQMDFPTGASQEEVFLFEEGDNLFSQEEI